ncbi:MULTISPECIES: glycosyltransferase family 4 protein [Moorena]|uniref:Glycosyltransferase n=1 Tax=Moorena producens 3L TaxID=489825 RepID=F4XY83_9CYAN|nr:MULTISPECIES: glycosyltransferase family 4 protein [Moorena]EGJ30480.1 glycosyltransferase [Moorena producens 3L]OLT68627.1 hypothetical protein BI334_29700 [Moorena producens 3L]
MLILNKKQKPRILIVSNFYPPVFYGGYELGCAEVTQGLRERGFEVVVLTSSHRQEECKEEDSILRILPSLFGRNLSQFGAIDRFRQLLIHEYVTKRSFLATLREVQPHLVYFWNLSGLSRSLVEFAQLNHYSWGLFIFDHFWRDLNVDAWSRHVTTPANNLVRQFSRQCVLQLGKLMGIPPAQAMISPDFIHYPTIYLRQYHEGKSLNTSVWLKTDWGINTDLFKPPSTPAANPNRILYVGQVAEHKGVHVLIQALGQLRKQYNLQNLKLTLAGPCLSPTYRARLEELIAKCSLGDAVVWLGSMERSALPEVYAQNSILVFPSVWEEPMGIVILEAMTAGLAVVASRTGGVAELIDDGTSGLLFQPGDVKDCAEKVGRLFDHPGLLANLSQNARRTAKTRFQFSQVLDRISSDLLKRCSM